MLLETDDFGRDFGSGRGELYGLLSTRIVQPSSSRSPAASPAVVRSGASDGLTLLPEDMPAPDASAGSGAPEAPPKRHGRQIDRVYRELLVQFPPNGKTPARMTINTITRKLAPGWKAENKEYGLTDPSPDVVAAAVKIVGRRAD